MTAHVKMANYEVTPTDKYVTSSTMRNLGLATAYEHVVQFLRDEGGTASIKAIQNHLAKIALAETHISVHTFFRKSNWDQFRQGIHMVNPAVWSPSYTARFGEPLPIYVGKTHTRGEWDLIEVGAFSRINCESDHKDAKPSNEIKAASTTTKESLNTSIEKPRKNPLLDAIARLLFSMFK